MSEKIGDNLWRLDIPLVGSPLKNLNSYLVRGERNLLIDTGFRKPACRDALFRQLEQLGVDLNRTDLFLTHLHSDHTGLAMELHRPGCRIYMSETDGGLLAASSTRRWESLYRRYQADGFQAEEMEHLWHGNPAKESAPLKFCGCSPLREGDELCCGGYRFRCVETPGHTPGHMCLYEPDRRILVSGDHVLYHITPNITRWETMPDALGSYLLSLKKIRDLPVETVLPAHRGVEGPLQERVDELIRHHHRRLDEALRTIREYPGLNAYQAAGHMKWSIRCNSWEEFPLTQKFFAVGEALSHLDYLAIRGQIVRRTENGINRWYPL
jgi:glyoxylase-like metal-dependent hydrolase (beta-lactamase superfamily II)